MADDETAGFWRTALARTLIGWMAVSVLLVVGIGPLGEALPMAPILSLAVATVILPVLPLLGWSLLAMFTRPRRNWPAVALLVVFSAVFVAGLNPLFRVGAWLYFLSRQAAYERIMDEGRGGLLPLDREGRLVGRRYGASYYVATSGRPVAQFDWSYEPNGFFGVIYDELECYGRRPAPPPPEPLPKAREDGIEPPTIKNAGRLGGSRWPLSSEACLAHFVW